MHCTVKCSEFTCTLWRSALAALASSSGVSSEREAFMNLVKNEIERLNQEIGQRGSVAMIFQRGNIKVRISCAPPSACVHLTLFLS